MARRLLAALFALAALPAQADTLNVANESGYARLTFTLAPTAHIQASATQGVLTLAFDRKPGVDPLGLSQSLPAYITGARADADGLTYRYTLAQPVRVHQSASGDKIAIDLSPATSKVAPPDLPPPPPKAVTAVDPDKLDALKVRTGVYQNFTRVVFDWSKSVPYALFAGAGKVTLRFEALAKPDFSALTRQAPPWVKNAAWRVEGKGIVVEFEIDPGSGHHDFRDGTHVVVDVLAPKSDADAYGAPGQKPGAKITQAQAQEVQKTVAALAGKAPATVAMAAATTPAPASKTPAPAPAQTAPPAAVQTAAATPPATLPTPPAAAPQALPIPNADGKLTRDGAVMTFTGAGRHGSAVFLRGNTAWIVLQDAPALDAAKLKDQLGSFPEQVDAASGNGVAILRLSLKEPEEISAYAEGSDLKVVIAPHVIVKATAIGFARNQDDATHSSLSTLLPGALRTVTVVDPVAGDELTLVPAAPGRALLTERSYVEFQALKTASGLALLPFVDDLSVAIDTTRVTITHKGGLVLTPPTMPVADSPAALARSGGGGGPCYLDFASWSRIQGGSFLATERHLRADIARLKPEEANRARLKLAAFYLAHHFAAETVGLIALMQASDPALTSDRQLLVMRAAADYEMGRTRDAHNDIAGTAFDADRHAALWRGLIETALQDFDAAQADLDRAGPVLNLYPAEWQARVRLAMAETALGRGHLEVADAALARLPQTLSPDDMLDAQLSRARLYAAESRTRDANVLFSAVERGGNERDAARAIYYRVTSGLAAGTVQAPAAIAALERLRYRWRGDALEMATLRKLSALYFGKQRWRDGLHTLRVAAQSFPGDDLAREAQDDMRGAFVSLFLRGKADKLPPVEALSLFYDNIDLTPIGPEGDEMIRRMADRLVAVDLVGPAADLLKYQVEKRLDGVARAQVATKLAAIYLMDQKPEAALDAIKTTQVSMLPDDVNHQRMMIEARALAGLKRFDDALDMAAVDKAPDTQRLRADIYWQSGNWAMAGKAAEDLLADRWSDAAPLGTEERQDVLRAGVAYSLANDEASLDRLRGHFEAKMKTGPDASAFAVVSARIDEHGAAFRDAAAQVASVDSLQTLMKDIRAQTVALRTN